MSTLTPAPLYHPLTDKNGAITMPWIIYFTGLSTGDQGTRWTPEFQNLASTGSPSFSGMYFKIGALLTYFTAIVTPATDTSATAGSTYIDNFPEIIAADGACYAVSGSTGSLSAGIAQASSGRIYVPTWANIAVPVTVCGFIQSG